MHVDAMAFIARWASLRPSRVLDIGGRDINGSPRLMFSQSEYFVVDLEHGPGVDVVADAATYRPHDLFDMTICAEVLEHAPDPEALLRAAWECLLPGGRLVVTCATDPRAPHSGHDGGVVRPGEHYRNIPPEELKGWLSDWDDVEMEVHPDRGDLYACAVKPHG